MTRSKGRFQLLDLQAGVPTTAEDLRVLRRLHERLEDGLLADVNHLRAPGCFGPPRIQRKTFEGCEPFEL